MLTNPTTTSAASALTAHNPETGDTVDLTAADLGAIGDAIKGFAAQVFGGLVFETGDERDSIADKRATDLVITAAQVSLHDMLAALAAKADGLTDGAERAPLKRFQDAVNTAKRKRKDCDEVPDVDDDAAINPKRAKPTKDDEAGSESSGDSAMTTTATARVGLLARQLG